MNPFKFKFKKAQFNNDVKDKGGCSIAIWSPVHKQGGVSASAALISSYMALKNSAEDEKILVMSNEMSHHFQASHYLVNDDAPDGISDVCMIASSNKLKTPEDIIDYTYNIAEQLDVLGPTKRDTLILNDFVENIENVLEISKEFYKYIIIDTSAGLYNAATKKILEVADIIIICMPQDVQIINLFKNRDKDVFSEVFLKKPYIILNGLYHDYDHFNTKTINNKLEEETYALSVNSAVNKALCNRSVFEFIKLQLVSRKSKGSIISELEKVATKIQSLQLG